MIYVQFYLLVSALVGALQVFDGIFHSFDIFRDICTAFALPEFLWNIFSLVAVFVFRKNRVSILIPLSFIAYYAVFLTIAIIGGDPVPEKHSLWIPYYSAGALFGLFYCIFSIRLYSKLTAAITASPPAGSQGAKKRNLVSWATNAPPNWPRLKTEPFLPIPTMDSESLEAANTLQFMNDLIDIFKSSDCGCSIAAVAQDLLTPSGILRVPVEVMDKGKRVRVFFYPGDPAAAASHFSGVCRILAQRREDPPVYYATKHLPDVAPDNPCRPLCPSMLTRQDTIPSGQYAMWWKSPDDQELIKSNTFRSIGKTFVALKDIYSYAVADILGHLEMVGPGNPRIALPEDFSIALTGPENVPFYLSLSREKGIGFHFNRDLTTVLYRDNFWKLFSDYASKLRTYLDSKGIPKDAADEKYKGGPLWWLKCAHDHVIQNGEEVELFGVIMNECESVSEKESNSLSEEQEMQFPTDP